MAMASLNSTTANKGVRMTQADGERIVNFWVDALRLQEWRVQTKVVPVEELDGGECGRIEYWFESMQATVTIAGDHANPEATALHEVLHLAMADLKEHANNAVEQLGGAATTIATNAIENAYERAVLRLERALTELGVADVPQLTPE